MADMLSHLLGGFPGVEMSELPGYIPGFVGFQAEKFCQKLEQFSASAALARKADRAHLHADQLLNLR